MKKLAIYIHIPFCVRKCLYCDFLSAPASDETREQYVQALCREIREERKSYVNYKIETIFLGGGTPSLLSGEQLDRILGTVFDAYQVADDCEISMEVNPGTVTKEKLKAYKRAGVNRLSIGMQSAVEEELQSLGRIHSSEDAFDTYELAIKTGFNNINIDLMSAIPGQTIESWKESLKRILDLEPAPAHVSAYSLIIEEGTPFFEKTPTLPDEDTEREMYKITNDILSEAGYLRYEISNYAKPGFACRHNCTYWERGSYAGFGIGAASLVEQVRFSNTRNLKDYLGKYLKNATVAIKENRQELSVEEQMEEFMFLGLRMMRGVSAGKFSDLFGKTIEQVYPGIVEKYCRQGLLQKIPEQGSGEVRIALTERGIDVSNVIMADFLLT
ncbi:MAG: oxygen-independent coproporphyrinogen III oxidase [Lachnospiraceae bacterium]|nr:oxygen-independent coproporphyrinogen III oxidase [Lachnospiraceae bacterium]